MTPPPAVPPVRVLTPPVPILRRRSRQPRRRRRRWTWPLHPRASPSAVVHSARLHRGKHAALGPDVCVKELKDIFGYFSFLQRGEVIKRLKKELCAQAQVRHPAVVTHHRPEHRRRAPLLRDGAAHGLAAGAARRRGRQGPSGAAGDPLTSSSWPTRCAPRTPRASPTTTSSRRTCSSTPAATRSSATSVSPGSSRSSPARACPRSSSAPAAWATSLRS